MVAHRADGSTDFQELQNAFRDDRAEALYYFVFVLLYLDGKDLTDVPLRERKCALAHLLKLSNAQSHLRLSQYIQDDDFSRDGRAWRTHELSRTQV